MRKCIEDVQRRERHNFSNLVLSPPLYPPGNVCHLLSPWEDGLMVSLVSNTRVGGFYGRGHGNVDSPVCLIGVEFVELVRDEPAT